MSNRLLIRTVGNKQRDATWKSQNQLSLNTLKKIHIWNKNISKELQISSNEVINNTVSYLLIDMDIPCTVTWPILRGSLPV